MIDLRPILISPDSAKINLLHNVGLSVSPFTGSIQGIELPGARWQLTVSYEDLSIEYGRKLKAITAQMRGGAEIAHVYDLSYIPRRDTEPGTPVVNGSGQSGTVLASSGWVPNTSILIYGDQISYLASDGMYRMHIVTADVSSDASGLANISILPPLHNSPVDGGAITSTRPAFSAVLSDGGEVSIEGIVHSAAYVFTETLYTAV